MTRPLETSVIRAMRCRLSYLEALAFLLCVLAHPMRAQSSVEPPPEMLNSHHDGEHFFRSTDGLFSMRADVSGVQRSVTVVSMYRSGSLRYKEAQSYAVRYWPTCVRAGANGEVWVAGKGHRTGNTIIEKWSFGSPALSSISSAGGSPLKPGKLLEIKDVYDSTAPGKDLVENMIPQLGSGAPKLLVKFHDSKDIYSMLPDGAMILVASPVVKPSSFHCPLLQQPSTVFARQLASGGYVYGWRLLSRVPDSDPSIAVLYDDDMNGTIDRAESISATTFDARDWGRPETWVQ